jgi:GH3 auxin-responsive promoter
VFNIKLFGQLLAPSSRRFQKALLNPQTAQQKVQVSIVQRLIQSEYGKCLGIKSVADWLQIPIVEYHDLENWIHLQPSKNPLLTPEPIIFYEKTSGSRSAAKLIPYTKSLRSSFNQMFCVWAYDLIAHGPRFSTGKIYFCISPQFGDVDLVGLQDDSEYLDGWLRWLLSPFFVFPGSNRWRDAEEFKKRLSQALLVAENLEIISIWSPSFLRIILDYIQTHQQQLSLELANRISPSRTQLLLQPEIPWMRLWSQLKLISCWDSANAADSASLLRSLFPQVLIQGKGLLATEAPMTIPLIAAKGCVPVLDEVFFEFEDEAGKIFYLHEIAIGGVYEVILSQKGGLYRYRIGDRVRVTHFYLKTPCLEFIGRKAMISDLVGEKLHSEFVRDAVKSLNLQETSFQSLVPIKSPEHYVLLLDRVDKFQAIAQQLDDALQESPHYRQARLLGQLQPVRLLVSSQIPEILTMYKMQSGKWGDLKHEILVTTPIAPELLAKLEQVSQLEIN